MDLYSTKKNKVNQLDSKPFNLEKDIQSLVENNTQEFFNLEFVSSEFSLNSFRLDTLCFDQENKSFVIIEYKKGRSYSVIDQGYSYLSLMLNNKSDFILEYNENKKNNLKRDDIDWSSSKVIFISPSFNNYQKTSVNFQDVPFELWEIKRYSNNMVSLNQHISSSKESIQKLEGNKNSVIDNVSKEVKVFTEEEILKSKKCDEIIVNTYNELKEKIMDWEDIRFVAKQNYIGIWNKNKAKIYLNIRKNYIRIHILIRVSYTAEVKKVKNKFTMDDPKELFAVWKNDYKELYTYDLKNNDDLDYLVLMMKQKFDS